MQTQATLSTGDNPTLAPPFGGHVTDNGSEEEEEEVQDHPYDKHFWEVTCIYKPFTVGRCLTEIFYSMIVHLHSIQS